MKKKEALKIIAKYDQLISLFGEPTNSSQIEWVIKTDLGIIKISGKGMGCYEWDFYGKSEKSYWLTRNLIYEHIKTKFY